MQEEVSVFFRLLKTPPVFDAADEVLEKGKILVSEHTDGWNKKIEKFLGHQDRV